MGIFTCKTMASLVKDLKSSIFKLKKNLLLKDDKMN